MYFKKRHERFIADMRRSALNDSLRMQIQYRYILKILFLVILISSVINLITARYTMGILMFILAWIYFGFYWIIYKFQDTGVRIVTVLMVISSIGISIAVLIHGTTGGVAPLWILLFPSLALLLTGMKTGLISSFIMLLIVIFFYWTPIGHSFLLHEYDLIFLERYPIVFIIMIIVSYFYESLRSIMVNELRIQQEQMESVYQNQYSSMTARISEAKKSRHDQRHHFIIMKQYLKDGKYDEVENYIDQYYNSLPFEESLTYCDHYATNALLTYYAQIAKEEDILFDVKISYPKELPYETNDLTVIFGNLIENAVHANLDGLRESETFKPWINIKGSFSGNALIFTIENASLHEAKTNEHNVYVSSKHEGAGIGIQSVQTMVDHYNGMFTIEQTNNAFNAKIIIYPKEVS